MERDPDQQQGPDHAEQAGVELRRFEKAGEHDQPQTFTVPGFTPWQTSSFLIQPASMTTSRLSRVIGTGVRNTAFISTFLGPPLNVTAPGTSLIFLPSARSAAISAALLPSARASFHTDTVCVPRAMRLSAA